MFVREKCTISSQIYLLPLQGVRGGGEARRRWNGEMPKQPEAGMSGTHLAGGLRSSRRGVGSTEQAEAPDSTPAGGLRGDRAAEDEALAIPSLLP